MGHDVVEHHGPKMLQVSGCYRNFQGSSPSVLIEHCCLMTQGNKWDIDIKCRQTLGRSRGDWKSIKDVYPDAKVEHKHNDIEVTLPRLKEDLEIAAFGKPGKDDQKRMQLMIFGKEPTQGKDWKIWIYLVDDTTTAYKQVCQKEEERGHRLLVPLAGMFVSNSKKDIRIELSALQPGWKIKGSEVKTIKSNVAWNSPENSTDFPCCHFQISHVDRTNQAFFCVITASHEQDTAISEIVAYFKREKGQGNIHPSKNLPKVDNTNAWLPTFLVFFSLVSYRGNPNSRLKRFNPTKHHEPHYLTKKASAVEILKTLKINAFQNQPIKEVN